MWESTPAFVFTSVQDAKIDKAAHNPPLSEEATGIVGSSQNTISLTTKESVRSIWTSDVCRDLFHCYNLSKPDVRGYMKRMHTIWIELRPQFAYLTPQNLRDQVASLKDRGFDPTNASVDQAETTVHGLLAPPGDRGQETARARPGESAGDDEELETRFRQHLDKARCSERRLPVHFKQNASAEILAKMQVILERNLTPDSDLRDLDLAMYAAAVTITKKRQVSERLRTLSTRTKQLKEKIVEWRRRASHTQSLMDYLKTGRAFTPKIRRIANEIRRRHRTINMNMLIMLKETAVDKLQSLAAAKRKLEITKKRIEQNELFYSNPARLFQQKTTHDSSKLSVDVIEPYWRNIYETKVPFPDNSQGIRCFLDYCQGHKHQMVPFTPITEADILNAVKTKKNFSAPGPDGINNYWWKKLTTSHKHLARLFNTAIAEGTFPAWMCEGRTTLIYKKGDPKDPKNYRPITCLNTIYKILTSVLLARILDTIEPIWKNICEQKGCKRGTAGVQENILIDTCVVKDAITYKRNLSLAWIDYKKAFDSSSHQLILTLLEAMNVHPLIISALKEIMSNWTIKIVIGKGKEITTSSPIQYQRGIFQGDSLSPILFCITLFPLTLLLRKLPGYLAGSPNNRTSKITHLFYVDDLKIYATNEKDLQKAIRTVHEFSTEIGMEFGLEKCAVVHLKRGKLAESDSELELVDGSAIRHLSHDEDYEYLGIPQREINKAHDFKEKVKQRYCDKLRKIWTSHLNAINKCKATNSLAIPLISYTFGSVKWNVEELLEVDRKTRRIMTEARSHHPTASVQRLYISRALGGRGLLGAENLHNQLVISAAHKVYNTQDPLLLIVRNHEMIGKASFLFKAAERAAQACNVRLHFNHKPDKRPSNLANAPLKEVNRQTRSATREILFDEHQGKNMHGMFYRNINQLELSTRLTFGFLTSPALYSETEGFIVACQDGVYASSAYKHTVMGMTNIDTKCRACRRDTETLMHLLSACPKYAPNLYISRHDAALRVVYFQLRFMYGIDPERKPPYIETNIPTVTITDETKIFWNFGFSTTTKIQANKPDMAVLHAPTKELFIIEMSCPGETNIREKEQEKKLKYTDLMFQLRLSYPGYKIIFVPLIIGVLGGIHQTLMQSIMALHIEEKKAINIINEMQKYVILGSLRILRSHEARHPQS